MTMKSHVDPKHFRDRAEELFTLAEQMTDAGCRRIMLRMVAEYEVLALRAEEREQKKGQGK